MQKFSAASPFIPENAACVEVPSLSGSLRATNAVSDEQRVSIDALHKHARCSFFTRGDVSDLFLFVEVDDLALKTQFSPQTKQLILKWSDAFDDIEPANDTVSSDEEEEDEVASNHIFLKQYHPWFSIENNLDILDVTPTTVTKPPTATPTSTPSEYTDLLQYINTPNRRDLSFDEFFDLCERSITKVAGYLYILDHDTVNEEKSFLVLSYQIAANMFMEYFHESESASGKKRMVSSFNRYLRTKSCNPQKGRAECLPPPLEVPCGTLNIWTGFPNDRLSPNEDRFRAECDELIEFIHDLFGEQPATSQYILMWLAHMIHFPGTKNRLIALLGPQGVGKNIFASLIEGLVGEKRVTVSTNPKRDFLGQFNGPVEGKILCVVNETRSSDVREAKEDLKALVTDTKLVLNKKGVDQQSIRSFMRWLILSNNYDAVVALMSEQNQRRVCGFEASAKHLGNSKYFARIGTLIKNKQVITTLFHRIKNMFPVAEVEEHPSFNPPSQLLQETLMVTHDHPLVAFIKHLTFTIDPMSLDERIRPDNKVDFMYRFIRPTSFYQAYSDFCLKVLKFEKVTPFKAVMTQLLSDVPKHVLYQSDKKYCGSNPIMFNKKAAFDVYERDLLPKLDEFLSTVGHPQVPLSCDEVFTQYRHFIESEGLECQIEPHVFPLYITKCQDVRLMQYYDQSSRTMIRNLSFNAAETPKRMKEVYTF